MSADGSGTDPDLSAHLRRVGAADSQIEGLDDTELIGLAGSRDLKGIGRPVNVWFLGPAV